MWMAEKVIVIGGGVAGMTVAHELAQRNFEVIVYEQRDVPGGKARSIDAEGELTHTPGLPGEHGFRFFPGFYRHVTDTMSRIPVGGGRTVFQNLTQSTRIEVAQRGRRALVSPAQFPRSLGELELTLATGWDFATQLGIPIGDQLHFYELLWRLLCACDARRFDEFESESWWRFSGAQQRSPGYRRYLADGLTRTLVAARAREMSARTGGYILLQLLQDMVRPGAQVDRVLNAPTNQA